MNHRFGWAALAAGVAACALPATAGAVTYVADLAPARGLPPVGQVTVDFDPTANTIRFLVTAAAGSLEQGEHQLHLHANYLGNLSIGDPLTEQVEALPPAPTDDLDGDAVLEVFEAVPVIGESWWTIATVAAADDGSLNYDSGLLAVGPGTIFGPDPVDVGSPGVSGPEEFDYPFNVDNVGFYRSALERFDLLAFDIHGANDPGGVGAPQGEVDEFDGYEPLRPALGGAFGAAVVPEPASWAMMIAGFSLAGGAMRRSRARSPRFA